MKKFTLFLFFVAGLVSLQAQDLMSNDSINNADGSNCELVGNLILPVAKRRKEDLVSFLNIR